MVVRMRTLGRGWPFHGSLSSKVYPLDTLLTRGLVHESICVVNVEIRPTHALRQFSLLQSVRILSTLHRILIWV